MAFTIDTIAISNFECIHISDTHTNSYIEISTKGGLLNAWVVKPNAESLDIIAGNDFTNGWGNFETNGFRSGKMSPFACRLNNGKYVHENKQYTIDKFYLGKHAIHGILYDAKFTLNSSEITEEAASIILEHDYKGEDAGFPFNYTMQIKWQLHKNNRITVQTIVTNNTASIIPMADGWHPYFTLGTSIDDCTISFSCVGQLEYDSELLPTKKIIEENSFEKRKSLKGAELDNGYLLKDENNSCTLENELYALQITPISNYNYLQLYIPPNRECIAIENLSGAPDCFNNKMGLQELKPHENLYLKLLTSL